MRNLVLLLALIQAATSFAATPCDSAARGDRDRILFSNWGRHGVIQRIETHDGWPDSGLQAPITKPFHYPLSILLVLRNLPYLKSLSRVNNIIEDFEHIFISPNHKYIVSYSNYGHTRVHLVGEGEEPFPLIYHGDTGSALQDGVLAVGNRFFVLAQGMNPYTGEPGSFITLRSLKRPEKVIWARGEQEQINSLIFDRGEDHLIYTTKNEVFMYDIAAQKDIELEPDYPRSLEISTAALMPIGNELVLGFRNLLDKPLGTFIMTLALDTYNQSELSEIDDMSTVVAIGYYDKRKITLQGRFRSDPLFKDWILQPRPKRPFFYRKTSLYAP